MASYKGTISEIIQETPFIKIFRIELAEGIFQYKSGQFVMLSIDGVNNEKGLIVKRSYSVASSSLNKDYLELCIAIKPDGKFTPVLNAIKVGDKINVDGPFGVFNLKEHDKGKIYFIATGAGIAPLISMIRTLIGNKFAHEMILLYGFRNPEDYCYKKELTGYTSKKNFKIYPTISAKEIPSSWKLDTGRVTTIIGKYLKAEETEVVYICGNPDMVKDTVSILKELKIEDSKIIKEQW